MGRRASNILLNLWLYAMVYKGETRFFMARPMDPEDLKREAVLPVFLVYLFLLFQFCGLHWLTHRFKAIHDLVIAAEIRLDTRYLTHGDAWALQAKKTIHYLTGNSTFYLDFVNGNDSADGSTFALGGLPTVGPWLTFTSGATAARIAAGDEIRCAKTADPVSLGNATFTDGSATITLASAATLLIDDCESAWTPVDATVTDSTDTTYKKFGTNGRAIGILTAFGSGKVAYKDLGSTIDMSAYTGITFWIRAGSAVSSGVLRVDLCSDATADTTVETFTLPALQSGNSTALYLNKGSALSSTVRSIRLYATNDPGAVSLYIDNFNACTASLNLTTPISKNTTGEGWYPIKGISGTTVLLGAVVDVAANTRLYAGTTETVTAYACATVAMNSVQTLLDNGSGSSLITWRGGYNTGTGSRDGMTWLEGSKGTFYISAPSRSFTRLEYFGLLFIQAGTGIDYTTAATGNVTANVYISGCYRVGISLVAAGSDHQFEGTIILTSMAGASSTYPSVSIAGAGYSSANWYFYTSYGIVTGYRIFRSTGTIYCRRSTGALYLYGYNYFHGTVTLSYCTYGLIIYGAESFFAALNIDNIATGHFYCYGSGHVYVDALDLSGAAGTVTTTTTYGDLGIWIGCDKYNGTEGQWKRWYANEGTISDHQTGGQASTWFDGSTGKCVYMNPASTTRDLPFVWYVPCTDSTAMTIGFDTKKTSASSGCSLYFSAAGCGITPINRASVTLSVSRTTYTSSSVTPTRDGFIRCTLSARDGSISGDIGVGNFTVA